MIRIVGFAVALALVTLILHWRFVSAPKVGRTGRRIGDAFLILAWAAAVVGIGTGDLFDPAWARWIAFPGLTWLAGILYLLLGAIVVSVVAGFVWLALRLGRSREAAQSARRGVVRIGSAVVVVATVGAVGYGLVEAATPRVTQTSVSLPDLPAGFDGTSVALVSDLHVGPARGRDFVTNVVDRVNDQNADIVLIAGDLIDGSVDKVGPDLEPLRDLEAPLGVFVVSGNHEFYVGDGGRWLDFYTDLGITVLRNEHRALERGGDTIDLVGIEDYTAPAPYEPDLPAALDGTDPSSFSLLMAHEPLQALEASDLGVDMQVSGHTHAGQIWPIRYLVPLQQPSVEGLDSIGDTTLFTTRGAGAWGPPVRVGAPPEISMLELTR